MFAGTAVGEGLALGPGGTIYVSGRVRAAHLPTTAGALQPECILTSEGECTAAFLAKINPAGGGASDLSYLTYLGGSGNDEAVAVAVDAAGNAHLTGFTFSTDFPTTSGAFQPSLNTGGRPADNVRADVFVTKINPAGGGAPDLLYSTYLGGSTVAGVSNNIANIGVDTGSDIAVGPGGKVYVTGTARSTNFPTTPRSAQPRAGGCTPVACDAFLSIISPANAGRTDLVYSTYLGGTFADFGEAVAVDGAGRAVIAGSAVSTDFPTKDPIPGVSAGAVRGNPEVFLAKIDPAGAGSADLVFSTLIGGTVWIWAGEPSSTAPATRMSPGKPGRLSPSPTPPPPTPINAASVEGARMASSPRSLASDGTRTKALVPRLSRPPWTFGPSIVLQNCFP